VLFLCLLSACVHQPDRVSSIVSPPPAPSGDPARHAQARLLEEAHRAFNEARYPAAIVFFQRFVEIARDSPRLAEAYWGLGGAFEKVGDIPAAMAQYRIVAGGSLARQADGGLYEGRALRRLDELVSRPAARPEQQGTGLALRLGIEHLPPITHLSAWFRELAESGVTAVAVAPAMLGREKFGPELLGAIVTDAHRHGVLLWVAFDLHQGHGLDIRPEWTVSTRQGDRQKGRPTLSVDVANPSYQSYLEEEFRAVVRTGCDGVLLEARSVPGFSDEFSAESLRAFAESFRVNPSPDDLFGPAAPSEGGASVKSAARWRWAGWKSRSYSSLVTRLRLALQEENPTSNLLVEVHESSLNLPLEGLDRYGEDVTELVRRSGGAVVVRRERSGEGTGLETLGRQGALSSRAWVSVGVEVGSSPPSMGEVKAAAIGFEVYGRWNMLIEIEPARPLP
jgi:tetratricopeptide (TPR) repeat protein